LDIVQSVNMPWLCEHKLEPFVNMDCLEQHETFMGSIHPNNLIIETLRAHETSIDTPCAACHLDKHK
jgi:hypothetical protein